MYSAFNLGRAYQLGRWGAVYEMSMLSRQERETTDSILVYYSSFPNLLDEIHGAYEYRYVGSYRCFHVYSRRYHYSYQCRTCGETRGIGHSFRIHHRGAGTSIPELIILGSMFKRRLVLAFALNVFLVAIVAGYLVARRMFCTLIGNSSGGMHIMLVLSNRLDKQKIGEG